MTWITLQEFVDAYKPGEPRSTRGLVSGFRAFSLHPQELMARDKANLDITWLRDPALDGGDELLAPEVIAQEIVEDLQAALTEFAAVAEALQAAKIGVSPEAAADE